MGSDGVAVGLSEGLQYPVGVGLESAVALNVGGGRDRVRVRPALAEAEALGLRELEGLSDSEAVGERRDGLRVGRSPVHERVPVPVGGVSVGGRVPVGDAVRVRVGVAVREAERGAERVAEAVAVRAALGTVGVGRRDVLAVPDAVRVGVGLAVRETETDTVRGERVAVGVGGALPEEASVRQVEALAGGRVAMAPRGGVPLGVGGPLRDG